ncbi:MAG: lysylphosphatidylglycerol synthase transmembrane domain-containing protein [Desulfobaccales bacterium]
MSLASIWKKFSKPLRYLLVLVLIYYLVASGSLNLHTLAKFFRIQNLGCIGLLFLILAGSMLCVARRQQLILFACGSACSFFTSLKVVMMGMFYNNFLPGGFGGDLVRLTYLRQYTGRSYSSLTGILLLDRVLGLVSLSLCALGAGAVLVSRRLIALEVLPASLIVALLLPILGVAAAAFLRFPRLEERFKAWMGRSLGTAWQEFILVSPKVFRQRKVLALTLLVSLGNTLLCMTGIGLLAAQLFDMRAFWPYALLSPGVMFIGVIPVTPGNLGWLEAVAQTVYIFFGIHGGAVVFLIWRVISCAFSVTGGVWQMVAGEVAPQPGGNT